MTDRKYIHKITADRGLFELGRVMVGPGEGSGGRGIGRKNEGRGGGYFNVEYNFELYIINFMVYVNFRISPCVALHLMIICKLAQ